MSQSGYVLYEYWRSSCSWRVRWALHVKGIPYQSVHVNLLEKEQQQPAFLAKNPSGKVPCLENLQGKFSESLAILEWLEETHPTPALLPQDPVSRLYVRQLALTLVAGTQPLQNLETQLYARSTPEERAEWGRYWVKKGLAAYEALLYQQGKSGTYSFGGSITFADLCLVPQCYNALRMGIDLAYYPAVAKIYQNALETLACQETHPSRHAHATSAP